MLKLTWTKPVAERRPVRESLEEYGRGIVGGLLFSLPLLYTMEIWWAGFLIDSRYLLLYIAVTFLLLLGYNRYAGMREDAHFREVIIDSVEEMGIGLLVAALVLFVLGRITGEMPVSEILGKIVVESMTVAIGVSIGTAQLGISRSRADSGSDEARDPAGQPQQQRPGTVAQLVLGFCGAVLFAANVAPTEEVQVIGIEASSLRLLALAALSLGVGAVTLFFSGFVGSDTFVHRDGIVWTLFAIFSSYAAALVASALMLWFFQRLEGVSPVVGISQVIVLAFPAMLGASAGRLLIQ